MVLHGLRNGDSALVEQVRAEWAAKPNQVGPNYRVLDRLLIFAGQPALLPEAQLDSPEAQARIQQRWASVFQDILGR